MRTESDVLGTLLVVSVLLGSALILMAMAATGRKIADLEYQAARADTTEQARIQGWVSLRHQIERAALGVVFVIINVLLIADAPEIWRMRVNRFGWTLLLGLVIWFGAQDWLAERRQVRLVALAERALHEQRIKDRADAETKRTAALQADRDSYRQMADEAVARLEDAARHGRIEGADGPPPLLAAVVPEHNSPTSPAQQADADRQTMRARLVASTLALGLEPRETTPPAEPDAATDVASVDVATIQDKAVQHIADAVIKAQHDDSP